MKRMSTWSVMVAMALITAPVLGQQTLGDAGRAARANKRDDANKKVYTNENLSYHRAGEVDTEASVKTDKTGEKKDQPAAQAPESDEDKAKAAQALKDKMTALNTQIDLLKREIDIAEREYRLRASQYYADAGAKLRDQGQYAAEDARRRAEIDSKKQALATAEKQMADLQEQARRGGIR